MIPLKYFVLKPHGRDDWAVASRIAIRTFADSVRHLDSELSASLLHWCSEEERRAEVLESEVVDGK